MKQSHNNRLLIFFSHYDYPRGGEKFIYELIQRSVKDREIELFVESISPYWIKQYKAAHIHIHLLWKPKCLYWAFLPITTLVNVYILRKIIKKTDVLFAANFPLTFLATLLSKNTILFCFEPLNIFYDSLYIKSLRLLPRTFLSVIKRLYIPFDHLAMKRGNIVATLNPAVGSVMKQLYNRQASIYIPNGVDTNFFSPLVAPLFLFNQAGNFVIGHTTDYTPLKGTDFLLQAIGEAVKKEKSILVLITETVSNPKKKSEYLRLMKKLHIQKNVRFIGSIKQSNLPRFYSSCNIFCFCGSSYCTGAHTASLSVLEAQSCEIPVLRTTGNSKEVIEGKTGFIIRPENTTAFSKKIISFVRMPKTKFVRMKTAARKYMMRFSWDTSTKRLNEAIQKVVTE